MPRIKHGATMKGADVPEYSSWEEYLILKHPYSKQKLFEGVFDENKLTMADPLGRMDGSDLRTML